MTLDENDYLTYQLYTASKTPRVKKARTRGWVLTTISFLCLAYLFYDSYNDLLGFYFLIASGLCLVFYPLYSRWRYKRHYLKYIQDTYKNRFEQECTLQINEDSVDIKDKTGELRINTAEIEELNEIRDYYFIKTRTGTSVIISKQKADDPETIKKELKLLVTKKGIKHNIELEWKWK
ncbi:MAG TPA: hypothetical protein VD884_04840 [Ohtaekwangia sp.]|nr:hypothetical protein [Ohtaekwangia sp.]